MSLGTVLDVIVGLAFTYLMLGMIASGFQEALAATINKRGKELQKAIYDLLSGSGDLKLDEKVFEHSLVSGLSPGARTPSYVPARNFALAVLETLRAGDDKGPVISAVEETVKKLPDGNAKQSLTTLVTAAQGNVDALRKSIETWFDDAMDRVTGVYKRFSQWFTLGFGLAAAIVFNVDSINLANTLWTNGPRRDAAIAMAQQYVSSAKPQNTGDAAKNQLQIDKSIQDAAGLLNKIPMGWVATAAETRDGKAPNAWDLLWLRLLADDGSGVWIFLGWLITALATSLGAPFWFDALSNLLQLRNAGPKPQRSDDPTKTA